MKPPRMGQFRPAARVGKMLKKWPLTWGFVIHKAPQTTSRGDILTPLLLPQPVVAREPIEEPCG